jgi:hypothetical protein
MTGSQPQTAPSVQKLFSPEESIFVIADFFQFDRKPASNSLQNNILSDLLPH